MRKEYPFFKLMVYTGDNKAKSRSKWFHLKHIRINHPRNGYEKEYETGKAWCAGQPMKDIHISSFDGLKLHASYLPANDHKRIVLLSHGYRGSGFGDFANTARFLHENGCDLLFIDQRCCGKSEGKYITFGAKEQMDILRWIRVLCDINRDHLPIYLYGESMGASAVIMASGHRLPESVRGLICDCGFSSMKQQFKDIASEWFHIPRISLLLLATDLFCRLFAGFKMSDADTRTALLSSALPILFFHGSEDTYVKMSNSVYNHKICRSEKELVIVNGARHLCSPYADEKLYRDKLISFFDSNDR